MKMWPLKVMGSTLVTVSMLNLQTGDDSSSLVVTDDPIPSEVLEGLKRFKVQIICTFYFIFYSALPRHDFYSFSSRCKEIKQSK